MMKSIFDQWYDDNYQKKLKHHDSYWKCKQSWLAAQKQQLDETNALRAKVAELEDLSTPPSTTALQDLITEVERRTIERCAKTCQGLFDMDDDSCNEAETCAEAIRALPTGNLKLEDLYMTYYLVLMNRENVVAVYSYDNEKAQLSMFDTLNRREYYARANPFYTHVQVHNEVD